MAIISATEMRVVEDAFDSASGYVANFTNASFAHFFRAELGVDIYSDDYAGQGNSKGKRLRCYLEKVTDGEAREALKGLRDYIVAAGFRPDWRSPTIQISYGSAIRQHGRDWQGI